MPIHIKKHFAGRHSRGRQVIAVIAVAFTGWALRAVFFEWKNLPREAVLAADWSEVSHLCFSEGADVRTVMERLRSMGVSAMVVRDQTLEDFDEKGRVLGFTEKDEACFKGLGLVEESAPINNRTVWVRDSVLAADLLETADRNDFEVSTGVLQGFTILTFQEEVPAGDLPLGPDPRALEEADYAGLAVVLEPGGDFGYSAAARRLLSDNSVLSVGVWISGPDGQWAAEEAGKAGRWIISPQKGLQSADGILGISKIFFSGAAEGRNSNNIFTRHIKGKLLPLLPAGRAAYRSRYIPSLAADMLRDDSIRFLRLKFDFSRKTEENMESLRTVAEAIRSEGYDLAFPASAASGFRHRAGAITGFLALLAAVFVPLAAFRTALNVIRRSAHYGAAVKDTSSMASAASPVWEIAAGICAAMTVTLLGGLWVHFLAAPLGLPWGASHWVLYSGLTATDRGAVRALRRNTGGAFQVVPQSHHGQGSYICAGGDDFSDAALQSHPGAGKLKKGAFHGMETYRHLPHIARSVERDTFCMARIGGVLLALSFRVHDPQRGQISASGAKFLACRSA
ncbi:MAG: DUF5693 family protein [bacterium]